MTTFIAPQLVPTGTWRVDPARSAVEFAIRHLMVATVNGRFADFAGTVERNAWGTQIHGTVRAASVETGNAARDERLREPGFFDAAAHPEIRFVARGAQPVRADALRVDGELTIAGITRPIRLLAAVEARDDSGRITLTARGALRRSDFGIASKTLVEAGVGDRVELLLRIALVQ